MTSRELNLRLITLLPEIKSLYSEAVSWQEGDETGSHVVFEDVLVPHIINCQKEHNEVDLFRCFDALEKILLLNDEYAEEVVELSVLESLLFEKNLKNDLTKYMGEKTKALFDEARRGWRM